jgi:hypothetical protein
VIGNTWAQLDDNLDTVIDNTDWTYLSFANLLGNLNCLSLTGPQQFAVVTSGCHSISGSINVTGTVGDTVVLEIRKFDDTNGEIVLAQEQATILNGIETVLSFAFALNLMNEAGVVDVIKIVARSTGNTATVSDRSIWFTRIAVGAPGAAGPPGDPAPANAPDTIYFAPTVDNPTPPEDPLNPFQVGQTWFNPAIMPVRAEFVQFVYPTTGTNVLGDGVNFKPIDAWGKQRYTAPCEGIVELHMFGVVTMPDTSTTITATPALIDVDNNASIRIAGMPQESLVSNVSGAWSVNSWRAYVTDSQIELIVQPQFRVTNGKTVVVNWARMAVKFWPFIAAISTITVTTP